MKPLSKLFWILISAGLVWATSGCVEMDLTEAEWEDAELLDEWEADGIEAWEHTDVYRATEDDHGAGADGETEEDEDDDVGASGDWPDPWNPGGDSNSNGDPGACVCPEGCVCDSECVATCTP